MSFADPEQDVGRQFWFLNTLLDFEASAGHSCCLQPARPVMPIKTAA